VDAIYPSLKERSVFITGGGSGIGASLVRHFAAQHAKVAFVDIATKPSLELVSAVQAEGHVAPAFLECDLRDIEALKDAVAKACEINGPITVLVNNASCDRSCYAGLLG